MNKHNFYRVATFFLAPLILIASGCQFACATITGAHGLAYSQGQLICSGGSYSVDPNSKLKAGSCTLYFNTATYVPHDGNYRVKSTSSGSFNDWATSNPVWIDSTISLSDQNLNVTGSDKPITSTAPGVFVHYCYTLVDELNGREYSWSGSGTRCSGTDPEPLPPTPPVPPTSCTINNANSLNVSLGSFERAALPTVPGSGSVKQISIPVQCSGAASITMSMVLNYTPITVSAKQVVKTSANGLGVAVIYHEQPLSNASPQSVTFPSGTSNLDFGFEAVRDLGVNLGDIPTGAFSASAVLVMTQQ